MERIQRSAKAGCARRSHIDAGFFDDKKEGARGGTTGTPTLQ
jgi:hypothetical protein